MIDHSPHPSGRRDRMSIASFVITTALLLALAQAAPSFAAPPAAAPATPWVADLATAFEQAEAGDRPLYIEFSSKGCGWCKRLDEHVHTDPRIYQALSQRFVPVRFFGGPGDLRQQHSVRGTPHTLIVAPDENRTLIYRIGGYCPPATYLDRLGEALARYREYKANPDAFAIFAAGEAHQRAKELDAAAQKYTEAIAKHANFAAAHRQRGWVRMRQGDRDAAIADFDRALELDDTHGWAYYWRGSAHHDAGNMRAAARDFRDAVRHLGAEGEMAMGRLWIALARQGHVEPATDYVRRFLKQAQPETDKWLERAYLRYLAGELDDASLLATTKRWPGRWSTMAAHFYIAQHALVHRDPAKARQHLEAVVKTNLTDDTDYLTAKADLHRLTKAANSAR